MESFPHSQKILINPEKKDDIAVEPKRVIEENCPESSIVPLKSPIANEDFPPSEIFDVKPSPSLVLSSVHFNLSAESSTVGDIPPPSSVSSSSSSSLPEQSDLNIHSPFKISTYDGNSPSLSTTRVLDDNNVTTTELLTTPLLKRRGPGRPRKDGNVSTVARKKTVSYPLSRINISRSRGRKRQVDRNQMSSLGGLLSGLSAQLNEPFKMGENSVSLFSQFLDNQEKLDLPDLDSDNSMSSAMSLDRFPSEEITQENWIGKTCSFCNLGEKSLLGQGELIRFEPTVGFNPFRKSPKSRRGSSESERDLQIDKSSKVWRRQKGRMHERNRSPRRSDEDSSWQLIDVLRMIGFAEEPDVVNLFEQSGHTYAHHCCASWSDGVCQTEDYVLINVDKAVFGGMNQKCCSCQRFGASIRCREPKCNKTYHYPCAVSSGTFQDIKSMTLLCPTHLHLAPSIELSLKGDIPRLVQGRITDVNNTAESESNCIVCDNPGNISELLFCTSCGHHYHGRCLDPVVAVNPIVRSGWQCPECKICHICRQPGDDNKMLVCDTCDKSYHTYCLKPVITSIPKHGWKCKGCRVCGDCGARAPGSGPSSRWHMNYSVCDSCYQQRNKGLACLLCGRAYRHFAQKEMIMCAGCKKFVHGKCDKEATNPNRDGDMPSEYFCPQCRKSSKTLRSVDSKELSTWPISLNEDPVVPDNDVFPTGHDPSIPTNEDSFCSMDIDIQAIERSAQQLQQLSGNSNFDLFDDFTPSSGKVFPITLPNSGKLSGKKRIGIGRPRGGGGSKFVGMKRRVKTAEMGKRRGPKPKLKPLFGVICQSPLGESSPVKLEEEPVLENKIVLCSAKDEFVLCQDMCIMCGSYGQGEEGRLISCSQCGQCYHPYCVSIKVSKVLLSKGWRCLDCTVCEGCGQPHDEGRLLLCDDCDISYHIYCLDPPLEQVPQGNWKCKWCVVCQHCGATDPGVNCLWQNNYTQCGPCSSQLVCPVCKVDYKEEELLIQCIQCDRWLHAGCDEMNTEEDAEKSADYGYNCILCRPKSQPPPHLLPPPPPSPPKCIETKPLTPPIPKSTPDPVPVKVKPQPMLLLDGVYLSESGMSQIKSLTIEQPKKQRVRRSKLASSKHKHGCDNEDSLDQPMDVDKIDITEDDLLKDISTLEDAPVEKRKRQRNLQKLGVGGFVVRCRGRNLHKDDKDESVFGELGDNQNQNEGVDVSNEKPKRRRRIKKKSQLEDSFPAYLQEAFFGKDLLVTSKCLNANIEESSEDEPSSPLSRLTHDKIVHIAEDEKSVKRDVQEPTKVSKEILKKKEDEVQKDDEDINSADTLKDILPLTQDLPQDDDLVNMLMNEDDTLTKTEVLEAINESDLGGIGISTEVDQTTAKDESLIKDDPLTDILSPQFNLDTMVGDSGLPQIDGKDVEDLFKGVLTDNLPQGTSDSSFRVAPVTIPSQMGPAIIDNPPTPHPVSRPPIPSNVALSSPFSVPPPSPYPSEYSGSSQFSPAFSEPPPSPWVPPEPELETQSYNQRNSLKWEKDELLGQGATISAVLYANTNHPDLKVDHPAWSDRVKQITKIWRALPSEKRTPYVQKARENRTASRLQKTQQMKESGPSSSASSTSNTTPKQGKRPKQGKTPPAPATETVEGLVDPNSPRRPLPLPPSLPPPPPPTSIPPTINEKEQERVAREQKAHREQEQERQWKALQAIRQQQAQHQQQILQEQRAQVPTQQPHPLPAMVRVQQQMMSGEQLIKSPTSCGSITPTTPSSPNQMEQFVSSLPLTSLPMNSDSFCPPPSVQQHTSMLQETPMQQGRIMGQDQLHGMVGVNPMPQSIQQSAVRGAGPFTPPIQVSRVRPPIDTSQMHLNLRMPVNDPYAQMPGTPRPITVNSSMESFNRPLSHHSPLSPQIVRSPVRIQDPYVRQPFTPRPPSVSEGFSGNSAKPLAVEGYTKPQMVGTPRPQIRDSISPATPRTPEVFHTPPSTPHTPNPDSFSSITPSNESFTQQSVVPSNHPANSFSPPHPSHVPISPQDQFNQTLSHTARVQESYPQQPATSRSDPYLQQPPTPMQQLSDMYTQQQVQSKLVMSPVARPLQQVAHQPDGYNQAARNSEQFQSTMDSRLRPKMSSIGGSYSSQMGEQQPQLMEHYGQPRTPSTPRHNPSPLDDPYAQSPMTPRPINSPSTPCPRPLRVDHAQLEGELGVNQSGNAVGMEQDQAQQMARQQLRDLLQKQQIKKQELVTTQGQLPLRHWPIDQGQEADSNQAVMHSAMQECIRMSGLHIPRQHSPEMTRPIMASGDNSFRQPYPPGMRPRIPLGANSPVPHQMPQQLHGQPQALMNQFRHPGQVLDTRSQVTNVGDPQMRMAILQQQQRLVHASQLRGLNVPRLSLGIQQQSVQNPMDSYENLIQQQQRIALSQQLSNQNQQHMPPMAPNQMKMFTYQQNSPGLRQQFVQLHQQHKGLISPTPNQVMTDFNSPNIGMDTSSQQQMCDVNDRQPDAGMMTPLRIQSSAGVGENESLLTSNVHVNDDHNDNISGVPLEGDPSTAEKVAEELQRIEKESSGDLLQPKLEDHEDDLDDDELLGLGNDFNILEYADPELDKDIVGDGKKTNILDENLDLDDKDEDLEDVEVKNKVDSPGVRVADIKVEMEDNQNQQIGITAKEENLDDGNKQGTSSGRHLSKSDFQAKFLEFSQKRELEKAEELKGGSMFEEDNLDVNSSQKHSEIDMKSNVKTDLTIGDMIHNIPAAATFSSLTNTTNILTDNSTTAALSPSSVCQMPNVTPNQIYMSQENNQMMMIQRQVKPQFSQVLHEPLPELRHQMIGLQQNQSVVKLPQPPPPPPYPGARPPPPYQPIRGPPIPQAQLINRGGYNNMMLGFRPSHTNQGPSHSISLSLNPAIRQAQVNDQRLLLEDLLEQEKQEQRRQQQQQQHHGLLSQSHSEEPLLNDLDFEKLKADVLGNSGLAGSLSPPGSGLPAQGILPLHPTPSPSSLKTPSPGHCGPMLSPGIGLEHPDASQQLMGRPVQVGNLQQNVGQMVGPPHHQQQQSLPPPHPPRNINQMMDPGVHPALMQGRPHLPINIIPPPQTPPAEIVTEADRHLQYQYESWLYQQQHNLSSYQKYFESEVAKLRKTRKSLNTKKRNLSKTGGQLNENDSLELERITREQTSLQKQLEQVRKQSRQHSMIMQEYLMKQQKQQQQQQIIGNQQMPLQHSPHGNTVQSSMINQGPSTPMSPLMSPSPLGPAHSPLRQQSPSPMMQHSPLATSHSPLVQHSSPLGQQVFHQQSSPRHGNSNLAMDQQVLRQPGIQTSQEDNNPFSDNFQHRELRTLGPRQPHLAEGFQDEMEDKKHYKDQACSSNPHQRWGQPNRAMCNLPSDQNIKLVPRGFHSGLGPRMIGPTSDQHPNLFQQHSVTGSIESDLSQCSTNIQPHIGSHHSIGQPSTHYQLSSTSCSQTDRNISSSLGSCIQTTSPSLSTGNTQLVCSTLVTSSNTSKSDSFPSPQSQISSTVSQQPRLHESAAEGPIFENNQSNQDSKSSLGNLLNENSSARKIFTNVGPNSEQGVKVEQSKSEDFIGSNEFNVEDNGSCVGVTRVRNPTSYQLQNMTSTNSKASYITNVNTINLALTSIGSQPLIKSEFGNHRYDNSIVEVNMLNFDKKNSLNGTFELYDQKPASNQFGVPLRNGNIKIEKMENACKWGLKSCKEEEFQLISDVAKEFKFSELVNKNMINGDNFNGGISGIVKDIVIDNHKHLRIVNGRIKCAIDDFCLRNDIFKKDIKPFLNANGSVRNDCKSLSKINGLSNNNDPDDANGSDNKQSNSSGNDSNSSNSKGNSGNNSSNSGRNDGNPPDSSEAGNNTPCSSGNNGSNSGGDDRDNPNDRNGSNKDNNSNTEEDLENEEESESSENEKVKTENLNNENSTDDGDNRMSEVTTSENVNQTPQDLLKRDELGYSSKNLDQLISESKVSSQNINISQNSSDNHSSVNMSQSNRSGYFAILRDSNLNLTATTSDAVLIHFVDESQNISSSAASSASNNSEKCGPDVQLEHSQGNEIVSSSSRDDSIESSINCAASQSNTEAEIKNTNKSAGKSANEEKPETLTQQIIKIPSSEVKTSLLKPGSSQQQNLTSDAVAVKSESVTSEHVTSTSPSINVGLVRPPFSFGTTRPSGTFIKMPLHKAQRMSLATQLSTQLDLLTGNHPQPFTVGTGRGLSRGLLVPSVQPRLSSLSLNPVSSTTSTSSIVTSGIPRVSQVGLPNSMGGRNQSQVSTGSSIGTNKETNSEDVRTLNESFTKSENVTFSACKVTVKQESSSAVSSTETIGDNLSKSSKDLPSNSSKVGKEKRLFNFTLASSQLETVSKIDTKSDNQDGSTPQNALLKQLLQTSQPSTQFPKKQEKIEPPPPPPPPPVYDSAAEVIASVAQLPPSPEHSLSSSDCGLTEEERNRVSLDELNIKLTSDLDFTTKGKKGKNLQSKRQTKQKQVKEGSSPAKKRTRKGSNPKLEEDYDGYMEALRIQLQSLPNLRILEPDIQPNFNVCPLFGNGQYITSQNKLTGGFGKCSFNNKVEFYLENPSVSIVLPPTPPPQRGFYNQEFPSRYSPIDEQRISVGSDLRRSMEIPNSILTPPPCSLDKREVMSPDIIISSSSPECSLFEPPCRYPYLKLIDDGNDSSASLDLNKSASPHVPLYFPIPIRARAVVERSRSFDFDDEDPSLKDKENMMIGENKAEKEALLIRSKLGFRPPVPLKDSANVAITLTITSSAAEDIRGVLSAVADLLKIPAPSSFEITERTVTPPSQKMGLYKRGKDPSASMQSFLNGQPKFCRHCDVVVLTSGIKKKWSEMPFTNKDEQEEDEVMFCSTSCYMQFALSHRTVVQTPEKEVAAVVDHICSALSPSHSRLKTKSSSSGKSSPLSESSKDDIKNEDSQGSYKLTREGVKSESDILKEASEETKTTKTEQLSTKDASSSTQSSEKSLRRQFEVCRSERDQNDEPSSKRWRGIKWKRWSIESVGRSTYERPSDEEINSMLDRLNVSIKPKKVPMDTRSCVLCLEVGDGATNGAARLLNMDVDKWVHLNCALWSSEVYETVNGALMNVEVALKRGFTLDCVVCKRKGATLGCFRFRCTNIYHFTCAIKDKCMFFKDKTLLCPLHIPKQMSPDIKENELQNLSVSRRVYINRDENRQVASMMHRGDSNYLLRVGNLIFLSIGQLLPHQLQAFHTRNFIYPVGYKIIRMYWSIRNIGKRCQYICSIKDNEGKPEFHIQVKESGYSDLFMQARTARGVWQQIIEPIDRMRREANAIKVFTAFITGEDLFGLNEPSILRVLESLPGVETLSDYNFKYGRSPLLDLPLAINPTGSARTEPKLRTHLKRPHTLHTSSSSRSSFQVAITGLEAACPYTKQFIHSKASQYRKMKVEWRNNVYLARSRIQGLGLYAAREIEKHTMVIEYLGELIRNEVAEKREHFYEAQNRGIYMFRVDDGRVIDASLTGGLARYINHSCNPNCVAEVVQIDRENRIIIFASRRIARGEELCYDYKFDIEDDQHKIPCLCGAPNCKKWMN